MSAEEAARNAALTFYQALDTLLLGKGTQAMSEAWHQDETVTTVHPFGHWARGWEEVWATWEEIAAIFSHYRGHADREGGIGGIHDLSVMVLGETAYAIGVYKSCLYLPDGELHMSVNCTNVLQCRSGVWKIVHHHPDQATKDWQARFARLMEPAAG